MAATARRGLWGGYLIALERQPLLTKAASAGILMGVGDVLAQTIEGRSAISTSLSGTDAIQTSPAATTSTSAMGGFDWKRTGRLMAYGFLASGPSSFDQSLCLFSRSADVFFRFIYSFINLLCCCE
jgi:hypothetical protein